MAFLQGELVVYGETGVCRVEEISMRALPSGEVMCYRLQPLYQSFVVYAPVENGQVFMRPIITFSEADRIIKEMPFYTSEEHSSTSSRELTEYYDGIIKQHDCRLLATLICSINEKKQKLAAQKRKLSAVDERFLKKSEDLLFGELAAVLSLKKSEVRELISKKTAKELSTT